MIQNDFHSIFDKTELTWTNVGLQKYLTQRPGGSLKSIQKNWIKTAGEA